jgi:hypothetical protein
MTEEVNKRKERKKERKKNMPLTEVTDWMVGWFPALSNR